MAYLMQHEPSRFLSDLDVLCQLDGRYTLLMGTDKVHGHEPLAEADFGILEYGSRQNGKCMIAVVATETPVTAFKDMDTSTDGTYNLLTPALLFEHLLTLVIGIKVIGEGEEGIKLGKVYHCVSLFDYIPITK
jgi:hypothetical protein